VAADRHRAARVPIEPECVTDLSSGRDHTGTFDQHDFVTQHEDLDVFRCI